MTRFRVDVDAAHALGGWLWVKVHDTVEDLRAAASRHSGQDHAETAACFQPAPERIRYGTDGSITVVADPYVGILRLTVESGAATIAHEATHAAAALVRRHAADGTADLGDDCGDTEEALAWLTGAITGQIITSLYDTGVWSRQQSRLTDDERRVTAHALRDLQFETEMSLPTDPERDHEHDPCCETAKERAAFRAEVAAGLRQRHATILSALTHFEDPADAA